jgi:hypothetical protein
MGVDFLVCNYCEETFPDCGYFVRCEGCGTEWCSNECAEKDGYKAEHCTKYPELDNYDLMDDYRAEHCNYKYCYDCEYYAPDSCNYCRGEDYANETLLSKALELLNMTREDLVNVINKEKETK